MRFFPKKYLPVVVITLVLFILPFLWLRPDEMDIGGDSTRLYFYDPLNYLINNSLYLNETITLNSRSFWPQFYILPYAAVFLIIKSVFNSSYFLISLMNGIKVSIGFLFVYLIIRMILKNSYKEKKELFLQLPAILGGLLYTTAPIVIGNYDKALISHDQIFLNPLCIYFIFCYFIKGKFRYLLYFIGVSFIFAPNFSWGSAPPIFAFYPLVILFLILYLIVVVKRRINILHLVVALLIFLGIHAFHLLPEAYSSFASNSYINQRVFSQSEIQDDLNYFAGVLPSSKLSLNILLFAPYKQFPFLSVIPSLLLFLGLCFRSVKNKTLILTGFFYLVTLYLLTANITEVGVKIYKRFFYIPGFSMFRNFVGQWAFVYSFFYVLLFGIALYYLFKKINNKKALLILSACIILSFILTSWTFFSGGIVNENLDQSNVKIPMAMDPKYEQTLNYIHSLHKNGAFASFPFTDCCYTVVHGLNNGAYVGPSPITALIGYIDYDGYQSISPFGEIFFKLVREKNYEGIKKMFGLLNISYIYYNDDPKVYDNSYFPSFPYSSSKVVFPQSQKAYKDFIKNIVGKEIYVNGPYHIYNSDTKYFHPLFYSTVDLKTYQASQTAMYIQTDPFFDSSPKTNDVYIDETSCSNTFSKKLCLYTGKQFTQLPQLQFEEVNPTIYRVYVHNAKKPYILVFSKSYDTQWHILLNSNNNFQEYFLTNYVAVKHVMVNGYANAWYIQPTDVGNKSDYTITLVLSDQKIFYIGSCITAFTFLLLAFYGVFFYIKNNRFRL